MLQNRPQADVTVVPLSSGAEEEIVTSLTNRTLVIGRDAVPSINFARLSKDTVQVYLDCKIVRDGVASMVFGIGPLNSDNLRYNVDNLEIKLIAPNGDTVPGIASLRNDSLGFFPIRVGERYKITFPEVVSVLAVARLPHDPDAPLEGKLPFPSVVPAFGKA